MHPTQFTEAFAKHIGNGECFCNRTRDACHEIADSIPSENGAADEDITAQKYRCSRR